MPPAPKRILLVNPTRYLGNLLIAGGLIQDFAAHCHVRGIVFGLVLDARYIPLLGSAFPHTTVLPYARSTIAKGGWRGLHAWLHCLRSIRAFRADVAFNIEEDSVSHRLVQLSGAGYRLGCSLRRHRWGYDAVVPVDYETPPEGRAHRWYQFEDVFARLGMQGGEPGYVRLQAAPLSAELLDSLRTRGLDPDKPWAVLHASATKDYKLWPGTHFARLTTLLDAEGYQVLFIGAGADADNIREVLARLDAPLSGRVVNLLDALSLEALATVLARAALMVGNDSGPFHLAAALGVRGVVIFGPTRADIWAPLSQRVAVLQDRSVCDPTCTRRYCPRGRACLAAITPEKVLATLGHL